MLYEFSEFCNKRENEDETIKMLSRFYLEHNFGISQNKE